MMLERKYNNIPVFLRVSVLHGTPKLQIFVNNDVQKYKVSKVIEGKSIDGFGFQLDVEDVLDALLLYIKSLHANIQEPSNMINTDDLVKIVDELKKYIKGEKSEIEIKDETIYYNGKMVMPLEEFFDAVKQSLLKYFASK